MFKITNGMAAAFVAIMLLTQIGIAQHNVVHFTDHAHYEHHHEDDQDNHERNASEACQTCLLIKLLSSSLISNPSLSPVHTNHVDNITNHHDHVITHTKQKLYNPRAPPSFLI